MAVEGLDERILPGRAGLDVTGACMVEAAPVTQRLRDELGSVVAADHLRCVASQLNDSFERADGVVGAHPSCCRRCERFAGVLIGDGEDLDWTAVGGLVADEVDRPDLVRSRGGQVAGHPRPTSAPLRLCWKSQPLVTPQSLHPLAVT